MFPNYYGDTTQREMAAELADYLPSGLKDAAPKKPATQESFTN